MPEAALMKYLVEYILPYEHICRVGVEAGSEEEACAKAEARFANGTLWDDAPDMPVLYDDYEEVDGCALEFRATECADGRYPDPDISAQLLRRRTWASRAAELLIEAYRRAEEGHSIDWSDLDEAYRAALLSTGHAPTQRGLSTADTEGIDPDSGAADTEESGLSPH